MTKNDLASRQRAAAWIRELSDPPIYDFHICDGIDALATTIAFINNTRYELVSVTQHEHTYTVFFRRPADG